MTLYEQEVRPVNAWHIDEDDFPTGGTPADRLRFLVRYAVLAPSSHNTQPWRFGVSGDRIDLTGDEARWLRVADRDKRELFLSLGCALENLLVAAEHFGLGHAVAYAPDPGHELLAATVTFAPVGRPTPPRPPELFEAILLRHTNHELFEDRPVPPEVQDRVRACAAEEGVSLHLTDDPETKRRVAELVVRADAIEFGDPAFRRELAHWIGQGVFGTSWLMSKVGRLAVTYLDMGRSQARKDSAALASAPLLGIVTSRADDRATQVRAGQLFQRVALLAAGSGVWTQPMSQIVQVPGCREELAGLLPTPGAVPLHPFRLGYAAPEHHHTPRRPLDEVLA